MEDWLGGFLEFVNKQLGRRAAKIITWIVVLGALAWGALSFITFTIDKIDWLANRFNWNIFVLDLNIGVVSWQDFIQILGVFLLLLIMVVMFTLVIAIPLASIMRIGIDNSQRGKVEKTIILLKTVLEDAKALVSPEQAVELDKINSKIDDAQAKFSIFREMQMLFRIKKVKK